MTTDDPCVVRFIASPADTKRLQRIRSLAKAPSISAVIRAAIQNYELTLDPATTEPTPLAKASYSVDEAAALAGGSRWTFLRLARSGHLGAMKRGKLWLIPAHKLQDYLSAQ